jgi:hypothetical protein
MSATFKPTVLIGVSTVGKLFTRQVIEEISRINERRSSSSFRIPLSTTNDRFLAPAGRRAALQADAAKRPTSTYPT